MKKKTIQIIKEKLILTLAYTALTAFTFLENIENII
jgi:hypothetical protein